MSFSPIDDATRTQITYDLAAAALRGINGSVDDIVASFERELEQFLGLDPDLQQEFPRGQTARIYGTALGDALCRELGFSWQVLADDYGTDLVVASSHKDGKMNDREKRHYTAPLVVVSSRFDDEAPGKLTAFVKQFRAR
ncbi:DUF3806 domain-containing protein [Corynebacterium cystitidis]|uniref:DUF3806 domain-containing protein n=1 Tax=Corynebacterium cystitidis DSM 20524 TaxID=1121357 RepID=A0A1H9TT58_9CORY|nr:DUF3806 domain-containing protein [Corynebacterium cystitidis]WJY81954.1 hypothetical protein CCYS_05055 [Corynebacterium cystitidis DSM 20524]SES00510.1 protein of unknown function [Corynebacterium cystitidis DSM 20524]SNV81625.1 Domain of uncharacterised function (DUF3806) [Corynebacterium cystitidis]